MICYNCEAYIIDGLDVKYKCHSFCSVECLKDYRSAEHIDVEALGKEMCRIMLESNIEKPKKSFKPW